MCSRISSADIANSSIIHRTVTQIFHPSFVESCVTYHPPDPVMVGYFYQVCGCRHGNINPLCIQSIS